MKKIPIILPQNSTRPVSGVTKNIILKFKKLAGINFNAQITEIKKKKITHNKFIPFFKKNSKITYAEKDVSFLRKLKNFQSKKHIKRHIK